jgi:hypothetical protein
VTSLGLERFDRHARFAQTREARVAQPVVRFTLVEVCTGVDDVTIVYRNQRDLLVTKALRLSDDGLAYEVRVSSGA